MKSLMPFSTPLLDFLDLHEIGYESIELELSSHIKVKFISLEHREKAKKIFLKSKIFEDVTIYPACESTAKELEEYPGLKPSLWMKVKIREY